MRKGTPDVAPRTAVWPRAAGCAVTILLALGIPGPVSVHAQGVRGELHATATWLEYLTVVRDSLPETEVPGDGTTRKLPDGTIVTCIPGGYCYWYRSATVESANPFQQDLSLTAWPGWRGVSARVHLRGSFGSDVFRPAGATDIEALNGYIDFDRPKFRLRAGRQEKGGGLGYYYFDGGSFLWKGFQTARVEAFAGRSLARTLLRPHDSSELSDTDELSPDQASLLVGVEGRWRYRAVFSAAFLYQREIQENRGSLYSERVALDARWSPPFLTAEFSGDLDVATAGFNEARLRLSRRLHPGLEVAALGRHYRPFLELWTIWGAFSPVGYNEIEGQAFWNVQPVLRFSGSAAWRNYEETHTGTGQAPIEGDGYRIRLGADWDRMPWLVSGRVSVQGGYGAWRSLLDTSFGRQFGPEGFLGLFASGTQQFAEFRFGEGTTRGAGVEARNTLGHGFRAEGRAGLYRHTFDNRPGFADYNQFRGQVGLHWTFGTEPGATLPSGTTDRRIP